MIDSKIFIRYPYLGIAQNKDIITNSRRLLNSATSRLITVTSAVLNLNKEDHDGKLLILDRASGIRINLEPASGSGALYRFYVKTAPTTGTIDIYPSQEDLDIDPDIAYENSLTTTSTVKGFDYLWGAGGFIELDGNLSGGAKGDWFEIEDTCHNALRYRLISSTRTAVQ